MSIAACMVVYNEADQVADAIRSVKAYVDRFIVVDAAFSTNPATEELHSTDDTEKVVRRLTAGMELDYILPSQRLQEHEARNLYLDALRPNEWAFVIDADEVLYADHGHMQHLLERLHRVREAVALYVYTTAVLFNGNADQMDSEHYATAPIIATRGRMPRLIRKRPGLQYRRDEIEPGIFVFTHLWVDGARVSGTPAEAAYIVNRHVQQPFDGYLADYAWEAAQRLGAV